MSITLADARQLSDEVLEALRFRALHGCERGFTQSEVADLLGVSRETVCRWWSAYACAGLDGLPQERTGRPLGSGRSLSDEQSQHIQQLLDGNSPEDLGIASPLWSRRAVAELIHKEFAIQLAVRTVGDYLHRWGYTAKKPGRHSKNQDPEEVRAWLEETYPAIEKRAAAEGADIYWGDETGRQADQQPGYGYAKKGQPATMEVPDSHIRVNQIAAISNAGAVRFMTYTCTMTAALFLVFLTRLVRGASRKIFLIVDRLKAHDARVVDEWVAQHKDQIELFYLPRYAPELNPEEYLNNDLKGGVNAAGLPEDKPTLRSRIQSFMHRLVQLPEHVRNYFQHPCVQYATGP
jgi:transposase